MYGNELIFYAYIYEIILLTWESKQKIAEYVPSMQNV